MWWQHYWTNWTPDPLLKTPLTAARRGYTPPVRQKGQGRHSIYTGFVGATPVWCADKGCFRWINSCWCVWYVPAFICECRCMLLNTQIKPKQHLAMTNCTAYSVFFPERCVREREFTVRCMDTAMLTTGHRREGVSATDLTSPRKGLAAPVEQLAKHRCKVRRDTELWGLTFKDCPDVHKISSGPSAQQS